MVASYAASSALAKQIAQGAPADIFVSANIKWMDFLAQQKLIEPASRVNLLGNSSGADRANDRPRSRV